MNHPLHSFSWEATDADPTLADDGLHLWRIPCDSGEPLAELLDLLSERERLRAARLLQPRHRERYIRAHAGLRRILALYLGKPPQEIRFRYGSAGKPALAGDRQGLEMNLTTSGDLAVAAVSAGPAVGVDCEWVRPKADILPIARRMLEPREAERLYAAPETERLHLFYRAWTALEARVKEDGRGLFRGLPDPAERAVEVAHFEPAPGFVAAVARSRLPPVREWCTRELVWR